MTFAEVDRQYASLKEQWQSGMLTDEAFDEALKGMMIQDEQGRWWAKARDTGQWNYYDNASQAWVRRRHLAPRPSHRSPPLALAPMAGAQQAYTPAAPQSYGAAAAYGSTQPELLRPESRLLHSVLPGPHRGHRALLCLSQQGERARQGRRTPLSDSGHRSFVISCMCSFVFPVMLSLAAIDRKLVAPSGPTS